MYLWRIFLVKPFAAVSIVVCLATIFSCFSLRRKRPRQTSDRFLIGFLGLVAIYQGLHILQGVGVLNVAVNSTLDDAIELVIAAFCLIAALMMKLSADHRLDAESALRLAKAAPPRARVREDHRLKDGAALESLEWALPRLSDGAFKLYAYLCMRADHVTGRVPLDSCDLLLRVGKTEANAEPLFQELQTAGACVVHRQNNGSEVEISAPKSA